MYRGREGQWAFILHRLSGVAIALYLLTHVINISLAMFGPAVANPVMGFFHTWPFRIGLVLVIAGVVYHAFNGLRIILMDFTDWGVKYQAVMFYVVLAATTIVGIPVLMKIVPEILADMG